MYNKKLSQIINDLDALKISKKERREAYTLLMNLFSEKVNGILSIEDTLEELFLKEGSTIRKLLMKILGLSGELLDSLDRFLNRDFLEAESLFSRLRDFFITNYDNTIDLIVYKNNKINNALDYFAGNRELDMGNITFDGGYVNEWASLNKDYPSTKYDETFGGGLFCKKISVISSNNKEKKVEEFILSFHISNNIEEIDSKQVDSNIRRIIKLFQKNSLGKSLEKELALINAKYKDGLTGAFNRQYANDLFDKKNRYSVIFIDVNDFKHINDSYGHDFGDEALKEIVKVLNKSIRPGDKVCRNGGDEFLLLIGTNDLKVIESVRKRIDENMMNGYFVCNLGGGCEKKDTCLKEGLNDCINKKLEYITVSTGIHLFDPKNPKTLSQMLREADKDMMTKKGEEGIKFRVLKGIEFLKETRSLQDITEQVGYRLIKLSNTKKEEA